MIHVCCYFYFFLFFVCTINVPVAVSGLGAYFLDGNSFLSKLCKCANEEEKDTKTIKLVWSFFLGGQGQQLRCLLQANTGTESSGNPLSQLKLLCRRIGDLANVVLFEVQGFSVENKHPLIKESVVPRPKDFPAAGLIIELPVCANIPMLSTWINSVIKFSLIFCLSIFNVCRWTYLKRWFAPKLTSFQLSYTSYIWSTLRYVLLV